MSLKEEEAGRARNTVNNRELKKRGDSTPRIDNVSYSIKL